MLLTEANLVQYQKEGFLVLPDFATREECDALRARAGQIMRGFLSGPDSREDHDGLVFTTRDQARMTSTSFLKSSTEIQCFLENDQPDGEVHFNKIVRKPPYLVPEPPR